MNKQTQILYSEAHYSINISISLGKKFKTNFIWKHICGVPPSNILHKGIQSGRIILC